MSYVHVQCYAKVCITFCLFQENIEAATIKTVIQSHPDTINIYFANQILYIQTQSIILFLIRIYHFL